MIIKEVLQKPIYRNPYWGNDPHHPSGYGAKMPTDYMVRLNNDKTRWRRVYCCCFSNLSHLYVIQNGEKIDIDDFELKEILEKTRSKHEE